MSFAYFAFVQFFFCVYVVLGELMAERGNKFSIRLRKLHAMEKSLNMNVTETKNKNQKQILETKTTNKIKTTENFRSTILLCFDRNAFRVCNFLAAQP